MPLYTLSLKLELAYHLAFNNNYRHTVRHLKVLSQNENPTFLVKLLR